MSAPASPLARRTIVGSAGVLIVRGGSVALTFAVTVALTQLLSPAAFGDYAWALAWMAVLRLILMLGFDKLVVREVAVLLGDQSWGAVRGLLRRCNQAVLVASLVFLPLAIGGAALLAAPGSDQLAALAVGALSLPLISLMALRQAALQGTTRVIGARLPEDLLLPAFFLAGVLLAGTLHISSLTAVSATALRVVASGLALIVAITLVRRALPSEIWSAKPTFATRSWLGSSVPLVLIGASNVAISETGTILVGTLVGSEEAGAYAVAVRLATLLMLAEFAANTALAPTIARLHAAGEHERLQRGLTIGARSVVAVSGAAAIGLAALAPQVLGLFGPEYVSGSDVLRVLCIGWLINLSGGFCGLVLIMTGRERDSARGLLIGAAINIPLSIALVSSIGALGAAIATSASMLIWNVLLVRQVWRIWRLDTTVFGILVRS